MKKSMKRLLSLTALLGLLSALTVSASAAIAENDVGVYDVTSNRGYTITAQVADKTTAESGQAYVDTAKEQLHTFHKDAVRFQLDYGDQNDKDFQLVMLVSADAAAAPTKGTIRYINQDQAKSGKVTFDVYPDELVEGTRYSVRVAKSGSALTEVGSFTYGSVTGKPTYQMGDVNGDSRVSVQDVVRILEEVVEREPRIDPASEMWQRADMNGDGFVNIYDASQVLGIVIK